MYRRFSLLVTVPLILAANMASAHKRWLLPTDFSLSDAEVVTVDFSASNNLFYVDNPMPLEGITVVSPDGALLEAEKPHAGARRSSFDVTVQAQGTYRVFHRGRPMYFSAYLAPGAKQPTRDRGSLEALRAAVPADATMVQFAESIALIETYITLGSATPVGAKPTESGLTLEALTHPNELFTDEPGEFRFYLNGAPIEGLQVTVTPEGSRYRDNLEEITYTSDAQGLVAINWPKPGRYLVEALWEEPLSEGILSTRYNGYFLTVEVLAP